MSEFTKLDKEIVNQIDSKYKWLARDESGEVWAYADKPSNYSESGYKLNEWVTTDEFSCVLDGLLANKLLLPVTWEGGPVRIANIVGNPILTYEERINLSTALELYKDRIETISKERTRGINYTYGYISVVLKSTCDDSSKAPAELWRLPYFEEGTKYKGMEYHKPYTIEELKLF